MMLFHRGDLPLIFLVEYIHVFTHFVNEFHCCSHRATNITCRAKKKQSLILQYFFCYLNNLAKTFDYSAWAFHNDAFASGFTSCSLKIKENITLDNIDRFNIQRFTFFVFSLLWLLLYHLISFFRFLRVEFQLSHHIYIILQYGKKYQRNYCNITIYLCSNVQPDACASSIIT